VCKCGMPQGKCGCPECALLEMQRKAARVPDVAPTLKSHCNDDPAAVPFTATAVAIVPPQLHVLPATPLDTGLRSLACTAPASPELERSTPPPRSASV
jgi:hypothetical protein